MFSAFAVFSSAVFASSHEKSLSSILDKDLIDMTGTSPATIIKKQTLGNVAVKVDKGRGNPESKNLHLSDDICKVCNGNLPKPGDMHELYRSHGRCLDAVTRGSLVAKSSDGTIITNA